MRNTSFLGKLLALTESTNEHEANLAKAKLEQQLEKRGINLDQLEQQLGDMSVVEEDIEVPFAVIENVPVFPGCERKKVMQPRKNVCLKKLPSL